MQFRAFEKGIEVNGQTVYAIMDGFSNYKSIAAKYLLEVGIGTDKRGDIEIIADAWYSQEAWLKAFENIAKRIGDTILYQIGLTIPKNAIFPPWITDIHSAVQSIDIAYHLNHRKNGRVLFDPDTREMLDGIGHYGYEKVEDRNQIVSTCENPYPCDFDRGIITTMAKKFQPHAVITHDNTKPCRKKGEESCTYVITW